MARFLFTTWEGGGHVQPLALVARGLKARGHDVVVMSDLVNGPEVEAQGIPFRPWTRAPSRADKSPGSDPLRDWEHRSPLEVITGLCDALIARPAGDYAADVLEAVGAFAPDVVVTQELLFGVMAAAEARGLPLALLTANIWPFPTLPGAPPFGGGLPRADEPELQALYDRIAAATREAFQAGLPALNAARVGLGLAPLQDLFEQLDRAGRILMGTSRAFDLDLDPPAPFVYVGPYLADPVWAEPWTTPWPADDARPLVVVSFSSMYQGQDETLRQVIAALGQLPVRGLVTLGPVLEPAGFPAPANVSVVASAPHGEILPSASVFVTHCGHGSTLRPLMSGVPLLCLPFGRDQPDNAARAVAAGAALRLPKEAPAADIAAALGRLLREPAFREAARNFGARIAADAASRCAEQELEKLVGA